MTVARTVGRPGTQAATQVATPVGTNAILAGLSAKTRTSLARQSVPVSLAGGAVLYEPRARVAHVYFPDSALLSIVATMADGTAIEVGTVGNEGFVGLPALLGVTTNPTQCIAQVPGLAQRIPAKAFRAALAESAELRNVLMRYAHVYIHQVSQRVACAVVHAVRQRCARWILAADDTAGGGVAGRASDGFPLTQDYLAHMLGVRREVVSGAARALRDAGLIRYSRGRITVIDRAGLEAASCECYATVAAEYEHVLANGHRRVRGG